MSCHVLLVLCLVLLYILCRRVLSCLVLIRLVVWLLCLVLFLSSVVLASLVLVEGEG